ncbi:sulfotransferase [Paracoccus sp. 12-3]|nr:sulfotransferase [Paracoccus xiamenensis]
MRNAAANDWAANPQPRKPSVLGIGAQKAGTSWLFSALRQHPGLWTPPIKESHYFDHLFCPDHRKWTGRNIRNSADGVRARYARQGKPTPPALSAWLDRIESAPQFTEDWYQTIFAPAPPDRRPVEITPAYSGLPPEGLEYLTAFLPDAQFIYLLRDPVDRLISQLRMNLQRAGRTPATLADWQREARDPVLEARGDYATYVPRWQARIPPDRLLFLPYGRIARDPHGLMAEVERFLGLQPHRYEGLDKRVFATKGAEDVPDALRVELTARLAPQYAFLAANFDAGFNAALR